MTKETKDSLYHWLKFASTVIVVMGAVAGLVLGAGRWILDRQSIEAAKIEHLSIVEEAEKANKDLEIKQVEALRAHKEEIRTMLETQHRELRDDLRNVQQRIDAVFRAVRDQ